MSELAKLLGQVTAATGADRSIDRAIFDELLGGIFDEATVGRFFRRVGWDAEPVMFTGSVDAALALVDRQLPGWKWCVGHDARTEINAIVWRGVDEFNEYAATPALAILSALLSALIAKEASHDNH